MSRIIKDIYNEYTIPQNLREHMYRVTAVGEIIGEHINVEIKREEIIETLLLHDMGNIIKFDLELFPEFWEPQGVTYWQNIQQKFIDRYGRDEHMAHVVIAKEIGVRDRIVQLVDRVYDFTDILHIKDSDDWVQKICNYADLRVGPFGILSLRNRLADGRERYNFDKTEDERSGRLQCVDDLESDIFSRCGDLDPADITNESIASYMEKYPNYVIV